jgi:hypothetical protein
MERVEPSWEKFEALDEVCSELVRMRLVTEGYALIANDISEAERAVACLAAIDALVTILENPSERLMLNPAFHGEPKAQIAALEEGIHALVAIATDIIPAQALKKLERLMT